jgi:hypothetical protein
MSQPADAIKKEELRKAEHDVSIGHLRMGMGSMGQRRPEDEDEGGSGGNGLQQHPIISQSQYFSGVPENISANAAENTDAEHNANNLDPEKTPTLNNSHKNTHSNRSTPSITSPRPV